MDPREPSNGLEDDLTASPPPVAREPGLAPAGSLMAIQIRRRTAPRAAPPDPASPPVRPAAQPEPRPAPAVATAPSPPPGRAALPDSILPPEVPAPTVAAPASAHSASDPGRRMQSAAPAPPDPAAPPPAAPPSAAPPPAAPRAAAPRAADSPGTSAKASAAPAARTPLNAPGIARYARSGSDGQNHGRNQQTKPQLDIPATKPAAPRPSPAPPPETAAPTPRVSRPEGIVSYWLRLRGSRRFPSKADLDQDRIVADWPNSILMRCRIGSKALEPEKVFAGPDKASPTASAGTSQAAMDLSPMMLQWLLTLAGDAARDRRPMQDTEEFPSRNQSIRYGAFALPFSDDQSQIDHVLCHVYRTG